MSKGILEMRSNTQADFSNGKYHEWKIQTFGFPQLSCLGVVAVDGGYARVEMRALCSTLVMLS